MGFIRIVLQKLFKRTLGYGLKINQTKSFNLASLIYKLILINC